MAIYKNDPFGGAVDYSQYLNWEVVVTPNGQKLYVVPGNEAYTFDPVASNASGRKVFRANPKGAIAEQQKAQEAQQKAIEQQEFNQSPVGQLLPVGASIAGLYAANQFAAPSAAEAAAGALAGQGAGATGALAGSAAAGATGALPAAAGSVATPTGLTLAPAGTTAGAGGMSALGTGALAGGSLLAGGLGIRDLFTHDRGDARSILQGAGSGAAAGAGIGTAFGGVGAIPGALIGGGIGLLAGIGSRFAQHKSTRQEAADKTESLLEQSDNPNYQAYVQGMRKQYESAPTGKAYAGKYDTFDEYKKAGLEANDLTGVYGNIKTYGEEWANLTEAQRQAVTQANIDSGLYQSKKGDVEITDKNKAIENKNNVLKGFAVGAQTAPANPLAQAAAQGAIAIPRPVVPKQPAFVRR